MNSTSEDFYESMPPNVPVSLYIATLDHFDFALKIRTGEVIRFSEAEICGEFVHLCYRPGWDEEESVEGLIYPCPRGVDVRISDIVWCANAPEGS